MNENITPMGVLYLIPTPLGDNSPLEVLPLSVKKVMEEHKHFIIENEKAARQFIKRITPNKNQDKITLYHSINTQPPKKWKVIWIPVSQESQWVFFLMLVAQE